MSENSVSDDAAPFLGADWFDPVEAGVRQRIRGFIEEMLEAAPSWRQRCSGAGTSARGVMFTATGTVIANVRSSGPSGRQRSR